MYKLMYLLSNLYYFLLFAVLLSLKSFIKPNKRDEKRLPPGPKPLMIIGNLPHLYFHPNFPHVPTVLKELAKKWGNVMRIKIGNREAVVFSSLDPAKYILNHQDASLRAKDSSMEKRGLGKNLGVNFSNGACWKTMREYTLRKFRHYGIGKTTTDEFIFDEADQLIRFWNATLPPSSQQQPASTDSMFDMTVFNVIWRQLTGGQRFELWDPQVQAMLHASNKFMRSSNLGINLQDAFPFMGPHLLPGGLSPEEQTACLDVVHEFCREAMKSQKRKVCRGESCDNFVQDVAERILLQNEEDEGAHYCFSDEDQFVVTLMDVFQNAVDSIGGSLTFTILNIVSFPEMKNVIVEEILSEFSDTSWGSFSITDIQRRLPYTHAFIYETLRYSKVIPIIAPREASADIKIDNYVIPKGALLLINLEALNDCPEDWNEPNKFVPERFLNSDGSLDHSKTSRLLSFGSGTRKCFGEEVAIKSIFTIFISVMKAYDFILAEEDDNDKPAEQNAEIELGLTNLPKSFSVLMTPRK